MRLKGFVYSFKEILKLNKVDSLWGEVILIREKVKMYRYIWSGIDYRWGPAYESRLIGYSLHVRQIFHSFTIEQFNSQQVS